MPKKEMDYSKCIIYKIQHKDNNDLLYVGHTTDFTKRKYNHKSSVNNEKGNLYNLKLYQMIRENDGWDNFNMIVVKEFPCENLREAEAEEDKVMREMKATMNERKASRSREELQEYRHQWYEDNKEYFREYYHQYYVENKEKINKVCICECGKEYTLTNKLRHEKSKFHLNFLNPCINIDPPSSSQPEPASSLVSRPWEE